MDAFLDQLMEEPIFLGILIVLLGLLVFSILKRLLRFALIIALGFVALMGYFMVTGKPPPKAIERMTDSVTEGVKEAGAKVKDSIKSNLDEVGDEIGKAAKKKAAEALKMDD